MKLRTEMRGFADGTHYAAVKAGDTADAINHDAAAAHALMLAMADLDHMDWSRKRNPVAEIQSLANALMTEWGFDTGEVRDETV